MIKNDIVVVTAPLPREEHSILKSDADDKGIKFGRYITQLLRDRIATIKASQPPPKRKR